MLHCVAAAFSLGDATAIAACRKNPLARAVRVDKLTLAALEATLGVYRDPARAVREIPTLTMLTSPAASVRMRAEQAAARLRGNGIPCDVVETDAGVGGGAFPTAHIPSHAVAFSGNADELERRLRLGAHPIVGRIANGRLMLDMRSVPDAHDEQLVRAVMASLS